MTERMKENMMKSIETLAKELKEIRKGRKNGKYETGLFGIRACKESIKWKKASMGHSYQEQYAEYTKRALIEIGFNTNMIIACEELMEESK